MKIAVSAKGQELDSPVDPRFGRAAYILIVDSGSMQIEVLDNTANVNAFKGAGIQAATMISDKQAEVLLTGYCGPNAFKTLTAANIKVAGDVGGTVREAIEAYIGGHLALASQPTVQGHW